MAPSPNSDKKGLVEGLQVITSALLSPQNPQETSPMNFGYLKRKLTPKSSPRHSPLPSPVTPKHQMNPFEAKADYEVKMEPSINSIPGASSQGFYKAKHDAPPPYFQSQSQNVSDSKGSPPVDTKVSIPSRPDLKDFKGENLLRVLEHYEIVIILDDSYTMLIPSLKAGGKNRWNQAWDALEVLVDHASRYTRSPIEIHFLNRRSADTTVRNVNELKQLRATTPLPGRDTYTPLGDVLDTLLLKYRKMTGNNPHTCAVKKRYFLAITDGEATDDPISVILESAEFFQRNHFPLGQVGIQLFQVGDDEEATKFLQSVDEGLEGFRDIVDTIKSDGRDLEGINLIKALTGGFNRKMDKVGEGRS